MLARVEILGLINNICTFLIRCYQVDFLIISSNLLILPNCWGSTTSHPHWNLILLLLLIFSQSSGYKKGLHYSFFFFPSVYYRGWACGPFFVSHLCFLLCEVPVHIFWLFFYWIVFLILLNFQKFFKYSKYSSFIAWLLLFWKVYSSSLWYCPTLCCFWWTEINFNMVMVINALWLWLLL